MNFNEYNFTYSNLQHRQGVRYSLLSISIDAKYRRLIISRSVYKAMGNPAFIDIGIDAEKKAIIFSVSKKGAYSVWETKNQSPRIYSKPLVSLIVKSLEINQDEKVYIEGKFYKSKNAVVFSMDSKELPTGYGYKSKLDWGIQE